MPNFSTANILWYGKKSTHYASIMPHASKHLLCSKLCQRNRVVPTKFFIHTICFCQYISRHTIVCRAAQEAGAPHCEYIDRNKENVIFTPLYLGDTLSDWNQICYRVSRQLGKSTFQIGRKSLQPFPRYELPKFRLFFFVIF